MKSPALLLVVALTATLAAAPAVKPLKALLVIGGCCHDYAAQKDILEGGIEQRANVAVDVCYSADKGTKPAFTCYEKDDWAAGYDVILHGECAADINDVAMIRRVLAPHLKGLPGVNLHCAMHSYRSDPNFQKPVASGTDGGLWFDYLGLQSSGHGEQSPIEVTYTDPTHPITRGFQNWTTISEELYNNLRVHQGAVTLAKGKQGNQETVILWTNEYGDAKTRVFSTTLGHNNETVADPRYLDLVTRGLLWACGKLDDSGKPKEGYGPAAGTAK